MIEGLVEEEIEKKLSNESWRYKNIFDNLQYPQSFECPEGYIFKDENGNVINATKIVLEKKKKEYPKTYEECCKILDWNHRDYDRVGYKFDLLCKLQALLLCRDAYWKIASEEMGLDKPWKPDWLDTNTQKYCIYYVGNEIKKQPMMEVHHFLAFPTAEMRDAFYENFKELIENCKDFDI